MATREVLTPEFYEYLEELESETGNLSPYDIKDKELETLRKKANIPVKYSNVIGMTYKKSKHKSAKVPKHAINYQKLKELKERKEISYKVIAKACQIGLNTTQKKFTGELYFMEHELEKVAEFFGVEREELMR